MPQKPLKANKKIDKKKEAANKHGKGSITRKGKFDKPPKKGKALEEYKDAVEVTKAINKRNEGSLAGRAESAGGKLKVLKAPPPALLPKDKQKRGQPAKALAGGKPKAADAMEDD
ncbi:hypothetical protein HYH02_013002 [Chlamydomonas schloesseri]|uniref:Uncharacterized protein n=1 Tax=Chlamydomonas schloesseri TaxID=2026947 RepID=A0A835VWZ9_9CHLO|nr:hypothetical protein HYH02_013002 [Chlamydomonas schloesseri]|eukprot:KAG2432432.1 hypothetical protein HYH02_013002 [Chlamydomonas schloesseri]